ncbi:hypothetical protein [Xenorhabdus sp. TH1]|uniref:hypothetical protein n=1 Tax=Xenorhabdus sp. TH1 TaxID=3130166 RepID=UPI0030D3AE53
MTKYYSPIFRDTSGIHLPINNLQNNDNDNIELHCDNKTLKNTVQGVETQMTRDADIANGNLDIDYFKDKVNSQIRGMHVPDMQTISIFRHVDLSTAKIKTIPGAPYFYFEESFHLSEIDRELNNINSQLHNKINISEMETYYMYWNIYYQSTYYDENNNAIFVSSPRVTFLDPEKADQSLYQDELIIVQHLFSAKPVLPTEVPTTIPYMLNINYFNPILLQNMWY